MLLLIFSRNMEAQSWMRLIFSEVTLQGLGMYWEITDYYLERLESKDLSCSDRFRVNRRGFYYSQAACLRWVFSANKINFQLIQQLLFPYSQSLFAYLVYHPQRYLEPLPPTPPPHSPTSKDLRCRQPEAMYKDRQGGDTNRSSSFYSEAYFQKARKTAVTRKPTYRERNKQFYDQQHQLDPDKIYVSRQGRCELIRYHQMLTEYFNTVDVKNIKGNEEYTEKTNEVLAKLREIIQHFHARLMSEFYLTREEFNRLMAEGVNPIDWKANQAKMGKLEEPDSGKLDCCQHCPIFIEEFEVNLERTTTLIQKQSPYWQKLNGNQKFSKFRRHVDQLLKVIKHEFEFKCFYARSENTPKPCKRMKLRLDKKPKSKPRNVSQARKERELQAIAEDDFDIELSL